MKRRPPLPFVVFALMVFCPAGCVRTASTRFYTLSALSDSKDRIPKIVDNSAVGIGPVNLPDYLDRPQIVVRKSPHELHLAELDKWAGTLKYAIPRVIAENLSTLLASDHIFVFPWKSNLSIRYQVVIDIIRFDAQLGAHADLEAQWTIFENTGRTPVVTRKSTLRRSATGGDYAALVQAESELLSELSGEIADAIVKIERL